MIFGKGRVCDHTIVINGIFGEHFECGIVDDRLHPTGIRQFCRLIEKDNFVIKLFIGQVIGKLAVEFQNADVFSGTLFKQSDKIRFTHRVVYEGATNSAGVQPGVCGNSRGGE